jgi:hypothetical protein
LDRVVQAALLLAAIGLAVAWYYWLLDLSWSAIVFIAGELV